jgi:hypothetical protein
MRILLRGLRCMRLLDAVGAIVTWISSSLIFGILSFGASIPAITDIAIYDSDQRI